MRERALKFAAAYPNQHVSPAQFVEAVMTFATSEAALAREQERVECAKAVCVHCREGYVLPAEHDPTKFTWVHKSASGGDWWNICMAAPLHERGKG